MADGGSDEKEMRRPEDSAEEQMDQLSHRPEAVRFHERDTKTRQNDATHPHKCGIESEINMR